ncbi:hypothetical protein [Chondromyces apiculatus]|uniref:Uncharacterized protein n=1 Tax=Chondromyces apiculatus DSM 436 TaxID=1192034 RepID=A0A017T599_9BACT|nr:hypothetical protein [Chondromyces apiculatus]EYF03736.1 Hypothetical protein CAP_5166 [Chondromyces apiculatus DSM 436]
MRPEALRVQAELLAGMRGGAVRAAARWTLVTAATAGCAFMAMPGCKFELDKSEPKADCADYRNEPPGDVTVRFINQTDQPIYLQGRAGCGPIDPFVLTDAEGNDVQWHEDLCVPVCERLRSGDDAPCTFECSRTPLHRIDPHSEYPFHWNGLVLEDVTMDHKCLPEDRNSNSCVRLASLPAGETFQMRAQVHLKVSGCEDGNNEYCECVSPQDATGWCQMDGRHASPQGQAYEMVPATYVAGQSATIDLVFSAAQL